MKIRGEELQRFVDDAWPQPHEDWFWDHDLFDDPDPHSTYNTDDIGGVCYQGSGIDPTDGEGYDLAALIRRWRKDRSFDILTVEVAKDKTEEVKAALLKMGAKCK